MIDPFRDPMASAMGHFHARRQAEAEKVLRDLVKEANAPAAAWNLLGVVLHQRGVREEALACIERAVEAPGADAETHNNRAIMLMECGSYAEAEVSCRRALTLKTDYPEAYFHLGNALQAMRRGDEAIHAYRKAITLKPEYLDAYNNLGGALRQQGRLQEAIACCRKVISVTPKDPSKHMNLGILLRDLDQFEESARAFRRAIDLAPNYVEALLNLGSLLRYHQRYKEATECYQSVLRLQPEHPEALADFGAMLQAIGAKQDAAVYFLRAAKARPNNAAALTAIGTTFQEQGKLEEAAAHYRQAIERDQGFAPAHNNLAMVLAEQGHYDQALSHYRQAIHSKPDFYEAWSNLGNLYLDMDRPEDTLFAYRKAMAIRPDGPDGHWNLSLLLLLQGDFAQGWPEYEWRWLRFKEFRRNLRQPRWDGSDLAGRTIMVHAEQGFGDTIQFSRLLPHVATRGGRVLFECQPELVDLMASLPGVERIIPQGHPLPDFSLQIPLMSVPEALGVRLETLTETTPYLRANEQRIEQWRHRLAVDGPGLRVGLSWAGRPTHKRDRQRSCRLADFAPLAQIPGMRIYSLQKWRPVAKPGQGDDLQALGLIDHTASFADFADTAAFIANLDLVIGVDTAIVHLAGALGKRVWTLLPFNPDWRWLRKRSDSPWYPTMRLFRQQQPGDWSAIIAQIAQELGNTASLTR